MAYEKSFEVRWADLDMNQHMRHTAYGDFAAHVRVCCLADKGWTMKRLTELGVGPVLISEDLRYLREIGPHQTIKVNVQMAGLSEDGSMWSMLHEVYREDGKLAATVLVGGLWIDFKLRKKTVPPKELLAIMDGLPKTKDYKTLVPARRPQPAS